MDPLGQVRTHSPLSPLTATSALYPDGYMAEQWLERRHETSPNIIVLLGDLPESQAEDDEIIHAVTMAKRRIHRDNASVSFLDLKYILVLLQGSANAQQQQQVVSSGSLQDISEDRLQAICKACGIDSKQHLFLVSSTMKHWSSFAEQYLFTLSILNRDSLEKKKTNQGR